MLLAVQVNVAQQVGFAVIALMMVFGAVRVVTTKNVVHAALWLVAVLGGAAAQYVLLAAEFVAVTQVLVYIGAVMVLFLFGTMLTRARIGHERDLNNRSLLPAALVSLLLFGTLTYVLIDAYRATTLPTDPHIVSTTDISDAIFSTYLLPFWALSIVLTAAVIGAIVLARRD